MILAKKQTYRSMLCPEMNPYTYGQLSTTKVSKIYNGKKTVSSTSGTGKTTATFKIVRLEYSLTPHAK